MKRDLKPIQALKALHLAFLRVKYPNVPDPESVAMGKVRNLKTTNGITGAIIDFVNYSGGYANRITSAGRKITAKGKEIYIPGTTRKGTPDVDIVFNGQAIKVEVKNRLTKDKLSSDQVKTKEKLQAAGATYFIAESFDSFYYWWIETIQKNYPKAAK